MQGVATGLGAAAVWTAVAGLLLIPTLRILKPATVAADRLLHGDGSHWSEMWMPAVLLAFYGGLSGALIAWRGSAKASLGAVALLVVSLAGSTAISVIGLLTARVIYPGAIPQMCWISLGFLAVSGLVGASAFTRITH